jgi:hypothetical protein
MVLDERLARFIKDVKGCEKKATNIPGIFLLELPQLKTSPASLATTTVDASGSATRKRAVVIRSNSELKEISRILL